MSGWWRANSLLTAEAVGMRIGNEVRQAVDWVLDGNGMGIGHQRGVERSKVY
jgi:hypothetical protein